MSDSSDNIRMTYAKDNRPVIDQRVQRAFGGITLAGWRFGYISHVQMKLMKGLKIPKDLELIKSVRRQNRCYLSADESFNVLSLARAYAHREGAFIEIGTFRGGSAKLISEVKGNKKFYICDTFEGLPEGTEADRSVYTPNQYCCSLESVSEFLKDYQNLVYVKGLFPQSAQGVIPEDEKFAFAHIDVDLYEGTLQGIEYLYPRMIPGGVIISHDFATLTGVRKAMYDFLDNHPETSLVELPTTQCMIIKP